MHGCVLRISGSFDVDAFLRDSSFRVLVAYRKDEPRGRGPARHIDSGFNVLVSAEDHDLSRQCRDAVAFLKEYEAEIRRARAQLGAEFAVLDFSTTIRPGVAAQFERFEPELVAAAGALGLALELSLYPAMSEE